MKLALALTVVALTLGAADAANAAATAHLSVSPPRPRVGQLVSVQLRPFWTADGGVRPAVFPKSYAWHIAAISPRGRRLPIRIHHSTGNPHVWAGTFRFPSRGRWQVCVLNFSVSGEDCVRHKPWSRALLVSAAKRD